MKLDFTFIVENDTIKKKLFPTVHARPNVQYWNYNALVSYPSYSKFVKILLPHPSYILFFQFCLCSSIFLFFNVGIIQNEFVEEINPSK